jgi:uncharacterized membrane protein
MTDSAGQFEMRRFEALSNTVFGVAMTLLAYDLPKAATFSNAPDWASLAHAYARPMIALALSFIVAGIFWLSHHRRLAQAPYANRPVVMLNVLFLMMIVLLPATNGLYGAYRLNSAIATVYAFHLTLIAGLNALLWFLARKHGAANYQFAAALVPAVLFVVATCVALVAPALAQYVMFAAFAAPLVGWIVARREKRDD